MKKNIKRILNKNKGFSLLELLLAIVLLAIVVTPLIQTIYTSMALNNKARIQMGATNVGQSTLELFESMDYTQIKDLLEHDGANISISSIDYLAPAMNISDGDSYNGEGGTNIDVAKKGWTDKTELIANTRLTALLPDKYINYKASDTYDFYTINSVTHNGYDYDMVIFITPLFEGTTYKVYEIQIDVYYDDPKDVNGKHTKTGHLMTTLRGSVYNKLD